MTYEAIAFQSDNLVFIAVDWTADHRRSPALGKVEKAFRTRVEPFQAEDLSVSRGVRHRSLLNESVCALTATLKESSVKNVSEREASQARGAANGCDR